MNDVVFFGVSKKERKFLYKENIVGYVLKSTLEMLNEAEEYGCDVSIDCILSHHNDHILKACDIKPSDHIGYKSTIEVLILAGVEKAFKRHSYVESDYIDYLVESGYWN